MSVLIWWLIPIAATATAIVWVWWRSREGASEAGKVTSPKELNKMARALDRPIPGRAVPSQGERMRAGVDAAAATPSDSNAQPARGDEAAST